METSDVINVVSRLKEVTMTQLAKELSYVKATSKMKKLVEELVQSKQLKSDDSGRYTTYSINTVMISNNSSEDFKFKDTVNEEIHGYKVSTQSNGKIGVITPTGIKLKIDKDVILLMIENPSSSDGNAYLIKMKKNNISTAKKEIIESILNFRGAKNLVSCVTKDVRTDTIVKNIDDVKLTTDHLMIYSVVPYNKAAKKRKIYDFLELYLRDIITFMKFKS
jgi:hypothetical protein